MYSCFKCKEIFSHIPFLFKHFRQFHGLSTNDTYKCEQSKCFQVFKSAYTFKTHLMKKHSCTLQNDFKENRNTISTSEFILPGSLNDQCSSSKSVSTSTKQIDFNMEKQNLMENVVAFSLNLHSKNNFTRKNVTDIQENVEKYIINSIATAFEKVLIYIKDEQSRSQVKDLIEYIKIPFKQIKTEYRLIKELESKKVFTSPTVFTISNEVCEIIKKNRPTIDQNSFQGVLMPLEFQIKSFFETSDILYKTLENMNYLKNEKNYCNFVNGSVWKQIEDSYSNKIVIPYFLYFDDYEINNPLGSHAGEHKLCGGYYSFPTIPKHLNSQLNTIFLACIFKTKDHQVFGNELIFTKLVNTLKNISENGILLTVDGEQKIVYFVLGLIIGDNLGLNTILGFTKSFNSNYYCRICKRSKPEMQNDCIEHTEYLRTEENYDIDVSINDYTLTGIRENSLFNQLSTYHVVQNTCVDIMHDLFEGVCKYVISKVILNLIKGKYFSIETFNYRKQMFDYGQSEIGNISPPLDVKLLNKSNIKMTASEMMTFIHFLPLMI